MAAQSLFPIEPAADTSYMKIPSSEVFPEVDLARIVQFALQTDQHAALREFRDELRGR